MRTIKQIVNAEVKAQVEIRGAAWLLGLGYRECNDYAEILKNQLMVTNQEYYRFETIARYVRTYKDDLKKSQTTNQI